MFLTTSFSVRPAVLITLLVVAAADFFSCSKSAFVSLEVSSASFRPSLLESIARLRIRFSASAAPLATFASAGPAGVRAEIIPLPKMLITAIREAVLLAKKSNTGAKPFIKKVCTVSNMESKLDFNLCIDSPEVSAPAAASPNLRSACSSTSFATAWDLSYADSSFTDFPIEFAYFRVAGSSRSTIPNSSSSSGSAFVTPRTSLLKESVKSLPNTREVSLAALPRRVSWSELNPAALPIAAALAASL